MNLSKEPSKSKAPKLKIKVGATAKVKAKAKKAVENKLNSKYNTNQLENDWLSYDMDIDEMYRENMDIDKSQPNMDIINNLPKPELNTKMVLNIDICESVEYIDQEMEEDIDHEIEDDIDPEIDKDALELETVGNKKYYLDFSKGIIYDLQYKAIGNIDEFGEINVP